MTVGADPRPTAVDDGPYAVNRNGNLHVDATPNGVLVNDTDPNDLALTAVQPTSPSHGTVTLQADGSFTYTPNNGYVGPDSFTYKARNSNGDTSATAATVSFNVVDQAPTALPDSYSTPQNAVLTEPAPGVLANDTDPNGDALTAHLVDAASHGAVTLNADGSFTYSPVAGFHGSDTFTYTASDGTLSSAATTVTIDVTPPPPNAEDDAYQVDKNSALHVTAADGVLSNDTPNDGSLTVHLNNDASHGSLTLNADGSFDYTPDHGFSGTDTFTYHDTAGEQSSDPATVTITVVDQAPVASPDSYSTGHEHDADRSRAAACSQRHRPQRRLPDRGRRDQRAPWRGDAELGRVVHLLPGAGFHGTDTFTYQASDGTLSSNTATVTIHVGAAAPPPPPSSPTPPAAALEFDAGAAPAAGEHDAGRRDHRRRSSRHAAGHVPGPADLGPADDPDLAAADVLAAAGPPSRVTEAVVAVGDPGRPAHGHGYRVPAEPGRHGHGRRTRGRERHGGRRPATSRSRRRRRTSASATTRSSRPAGTGR